MGFVNEKLTREQNELFNSWNVKCKRVFCGQIIREDKFTTRYCWTVDKEREVYLAGLFYSREFEGEVAFVFRCNKHNYIVQFHKKYETKTKTVIWDVPLNYIIDAKFPYGLERHLIDDLKNALYAYNYDGLPFGSDNECVRSIFNF